MEQKPAEGPNADQIRYWNGDGGARWLASHEIIHRQVESIGLHALDRAELAPNDRVLDVGCGVGATTIEIARRVGPNGAVVGLDVSQPLLSRALDRAFEAGIANASFVRADAQTASLPEGAFDAIFSRFGVMFFHDPEAAFRNLRRALRPGGRLTFLCWCALADNPWAHVPLEAVSMLVPLPAPAPGAPGPFAFAEPDRVRTFLQGAGFSGVDFEKLDREVHVAGGADLDETAAFMTRVGPAARALAEAGPEVRAAAVAAIREALTPHHTPAGVRMASATWVVRGRA